MVLRILSSALLFGAFALGGNSVMAQCQAPCDPAACDPSSCEESKMVGKQPTIVETAIAAEGFGTLVAAVKAAGLVDALQGEGPFTVFAPTDAAFAKLPKGTLEMLLRPENKGKLASILTYHVVPGRVEAAHVVKLTGATTLNGQRASIRVDDHGVFVDGARVVKTDIKCRNGVIHVLDSVILPTDLDLAATAKKAGAFQTLLAAAKGAGLVEALQGKGPLTVFAPTDEAFAKLPAGTIENLLLPENRAQLAKILKYHVVAGRVYSDQASQLKEAPSLIHQHLRFSNKGKGLQVQNARIVSADINASNGVIHVIDTVLIPAE